jgi:hypothetical protein
MAVPLSWTLSDSVRGLIFQRIFDCSLLFASRPEGILLQETNLCFAPLFNLLRFGRFSRANGFGFHNEAALLLQMQSVESIRVSIRHALYELLTAGPSNISKVILPACPINPSVSTASNSEWQAARDDRRNLHEGPPALCGEELHFPTASGEPSLPK